MASVGGFSGNFSLLRRITSEMLYIQKKAVSHFSASVDVPNILHLQVYF